MSAERCFCWWLTVTQMTGYRAPLQSAHLANFSEKRHALRFQPKCHWTKALWKWIAWAPWHGKTSITERQLLLVESEHSCTKAIDTVWYILNTRNFPISAIQRLKKRFLYVILQELQGSGLEIAIQAKFVLLWVFLCWNLHRRPFQNLTFTRRHAVSPILRRGVLEFEKTQLRNVQSRESWEKRSNPVRNGWKFAQTGVAKKPKAKTMWACKGLGS